MNLDFSEDQEMLKRAARQFLDVECPRSPFVRDMELDEKGYTADLWHKMAEVGWMGIAFPEEYDGAGCNFLDLVVLLEEMGRACLPGPFLSTILCGLSILWAGTEEQKRALLPKIASGEVVLTLALTEPSARYAADAIGLQAKLNGDNLIITGTKMFVSDAHVADYLLCVARTDSGATPEEGITLILVDAKNAGITCLSLEDTIAGDKLFRVEFNNVKVPKSNIIGELNKGWPLVERIMAHGAVSECARMLGGAKRVLEMSVSYAKERVQFNRPIGSFQAIQHPLANMLMDVDGCYYITYQAAWRLSEGLPCTREVSIAKAWVSDAYHRICVTGHQVHGGIGFVEDHDMGLYYRRAKAQELSFGDADFHRRIVEGEIGLI